MLRCLGWKVSGGGMTRLANRHVPCPGCVAAIRPLDLSGCPNCGRCLRCGRKVPEEQLSCRCGLDESADLDWEEFFHQAIPESDVPREFACMAIRRRLENRKAIVSGLIGGSIIALATVAQIKRWGTVWECMAFTFAGNAIGIWVTNRLFFWIENRVLDKSGQPAGDVMAP